MNELSTSTRSSLGVLSFLCEVEGSRGHGVAAAGAVVWAEQKENEGAMVEGEALKGFVSSKRVRGTC